MLLTTICDDVENNVHVPLTKDLPSPYFKLPSITMITCTVESPTMVCSTSKLILSHDCEPLPCIAVMSACIPATLSAKSAG